MIRRAPPQLSGNRAGGVVWRPKALAFQAGGQTSLYGKWLQEFIACRLVATTDDDTGSVEIWIPLPAVPGPFFARLTLSTDGANLASQDSGTFG